MRQVLSISLPAEIIEEIKEKTLKRGFDSVSAYIKTLVKQDEDLISAEELLKSAEEAKKEYQEGKIIRANSLMDLHENK